MDISKQFENAPSEEQALRQEIFKLELEGFNDKKIKEYMDLLHQYNEIKDTCQIVLGKIAEMEAITLSAVHKKFNLPLKDK